MSLDLTPEELAFLLSTVDLLRIQNTSGMRIKYSIIRKILDALPDEAPSLTADHQSQTGRPPSANRGVRSP